LKFTRNVKRKGGKKGKKRGVAGFQRVRETQEKVAIADRKRKVKGQKEKNRKMEDQLLRY